jgi:hypothetical protein
MHAPTLPSVLRHTRRTLPHTPRRSAATHTTHVAPATAAATDHSGPSAASWRISDLPSRARLRAVRWLPLVVPAFAVLLLLCVALIGSVV